MKSFNSIDSFKQFYYMLENPEFSQRKMAKDLEMGHGEKIQSFVKWLEEMRFVQKTYATKKNAPRYTVPSRIELLNFYSRFRQMRNQKLDSLKIGTTKKEMIQFLSKEGGVMCLTTALQFYDEYYRDPEIHVYAKDPKLLDTLMEQGNGDIEVNIYEYDLPDVIETRDEIRVTSPTRTIIDLFCNNLSYAAEPFIEKVWGK